MKNFKKTLNPIFELLNTLTKIKIARVQRNVIIENHRHHQRVYRMMKYLPNKKNCVNEHTKNEAPCV